MSYTDINAGKRRVDPNHHAVIPTAQIERDLRARFPSLEFPYVKQDHVAGVRSNVHAWCEKHQMFTRMLLSSARATDGTKYGCFACANEHKGGNGGGGGYSPRQYAPGYIGRAGVQSGIFRALKAAYPDTIWEHRMDNGKEIDVYVPSLNFGIEYNGNYYHSTAVGKDAKYHAMKTVGAYRESKSILHVFTDEVPIDFGLYVKYAKDCDVLSRLNYRLLSDAATTRRFVQKPCKAKQVPVAEGRKFVATNSLTFMSHEVLSHMSLYVGMYCGKELAGVVYGVPGKVYGVVVHDIDLFIYAGLVKYAQFHQTLDYLAPLRCPLQSGLQLLNCKALGGLGDQAFEYLTPHGYGLKSDNTITLDPEGQPHVIHDCGWISVRIKDS